MDTILTFIILRLCLVIILIITGHLLSGGDGKKHYWKCSIPAIIAYSLVEGLRYGRGTDYFHYKNLYEYSLNLGVYYPVDSIEPLFQIINKSFKLLEISYPFVFVFYSFVLIFAGFLFIKSYKEYALFAVPLFFAATLVQSENLVRQFIAFSFVLIALRTLYSKQWMKFIFFMLIAFFIHYSSIVLLPIFLLLNKFSYVLIKKNSVIIVISVLYVLSFFWKIEYWAYIYPFISMLNLGSGHYQQYVNQSDVWFSGEQILSYSSNLTVFSTIRDFILNIIILVLGYLQLDETSGKKITIPYFLFAIGAILQHITIGMELPYRIMLYFYMFWFIVVAYIFKQSRTMISNLFCVIILILTIYTYLIGPLLNTNALGSLFIWDI